MSCLSLPQLLCAGPLAALLQHIAFLNDNGPVGVGAELLDYGAPELVELEGYLAARATGMAIEAPGVRS